MPGGSGRGYHFVSEWQVCPRKWFLHHVAGLEPSAIKQSTSMGLAIHELQEKFYKGEFREGSIEARSIADTVGCYRDAWLEEEEFLAAFNKIGLAFSIWRDQFGFKDLEDFEVIGAEEHLSAALQNGNIITGLIDTLFRSKESGAIVIKDTKTTSWGPELAHKKVELGDQMTMYTWLLHKKYGDQPIEVIADILYLKPKTPTCHRYAPIRRSREEVENFILGMCHVTDRMREDLVAYEANLAPPEYLFPRCSTVCSEFGCEYEDICRAHFDEESPPPISGYTVNPPITVETLFDRVPIVDSQGDCP